MLRNPNRIVSRSLATERRVGAFALQTPDRATRGRLDDVYSQPLADLQVIYPRNAATPGLGLASLVSSGR